MTIRRITFTDINNKSLNPMRLPNPLAFKGGVDGYIYNPLRYPSPLANHPDDTVISKIKPLKSDVFQNSKFMTK